MDSVEMTALSFEWGEEIPKKLVYEEYRYFSRNRINTLFQIQPLEKN